ncbi:helix-turn-helix domain-containing protein [Citrobacter portucalensis]|uniref:Helix-turn-helix domain-containing protein n=1 Tax=Citrobacter portucalensis TaxID=1639133 RepID=A0A5B0SXI8_9ENTR|nr:helix-turn-helix domain-containing protein [Citrobacter portucalensis]KAA1141933.1 helix-turn-helix domain-containing protein [Citrobacter portucalensis]
MNTETVITSMNTLLQELKWLRGIKDDNEYETALNDLKELHELNSTPRVLLQLMAECIIKYEKNKMEALLLTGTGCTDKTVNALITLMKHRNIKGKEMAEILEVSRPLLSAILNGNRALTIPHIYKLAEHFGVNPGVFL